jgi:hypothetical protein
LGACLLLIMGITALSIPIRPYRERIPRTSIVPSISGVSTADNWSQHGMTLSGYSGHRDPAISDRAGRTTP